MHVNVAIDDTLTLSSSVVGAVVGASGSVLGISGSPPWEHFLKQHFLRQARIATTPTITHTTTTTTTTTATIMPVVGAVVGLSCVSEGSGGTVGVPLSAVQTKIDIK